MRQDFYAIGGLHSADFGEGTITIKIQGDIPPLARGRYVVTEFDKFSSMVRMADLWRRAQAGEAGTAETPQSGSVHEHAVPQGCAQTAPKGAI